MIEDSTPVSSQPSAPTQRLQRLRHLFDREQINLESHQLVWCDVQAKTTSKRETTEIVEELRKIVDYTQVFDDVKECEEYLENTADTATFLVCSGEFGKTLVTRSHQLKIWSMHLFCRNDEEYSYWLEKESMGRTRCKNIEELLEHLNNDVRAYLDQEKYGIFSELGRHDVTAQGGMKVPWELLVESLCYLSYPDNCRQRLVAALQDYYQNRADTLAVLTEFERDYTPSRAIHWYTRDTVLFRLLNRALRQQNTELLLLFGFYLRDLFLQLAEEHEKFRALQTATPVIHVYRGQLISSHEIRMLKETSEIHALRVMATNSFFSTSLDRNSALVFLNQAARPDDKLQSVLFEIEVDFRKSSSLPFADISPLSHFSSEREILFMTGIYFNVNQITYSAEEGVYIIQLTLSTQLKSKLGSLYQKKLLKKCSDRLCSHLTSETSEEIDDCFSELSNLFPSEEQWLLAAKHQCLGANYDFELEPPGIQQALSHYEQALKIWEIFLGDSDLNCRVNVADIHEELGMLYHEHLQDYRLANNHYELSVSYCKSALKNGEYDEQEGEYLLRMISRIYEQKMEIAGDDVEQRKQVCLNAIRFGKLELKEMKRSPDTCEVSRAGECIERVGTLEESISLYDEALTSYKTALKIYGQFEGLPTYVETRLCGSIARIYLDYKEDGDSALKYKLMQHESNLKIYKAAADAGEGSSAFAKWLLAVSHEEVADVYIKLGQSELACANLRTAKELYTQSNSQQKKEKIKGIEEKLMSIQAV